MEKVVLVSSDKERFEVEKAAAELSMTLSHMMEDLDEFGDLPLPEVKGCTLAMVVEYCNKHCSVKGSDEEEKKALAEWDKSFVDVDQDSLYNLFMAANYLDIKGLLELVADKAADMMKGKMPEEIRKIFNIKNDFEPEEEEKYRKKYAWAFESE